MLQISTLLLFILSIVGVHSRAQGGCICTPYHKCEDNDTTGSDVFGIVDDRVNILGTQVVISVKPTNETAVCPGTLEVLCCRRKPTNPSSSSSSQPQQPSQPQTPRPNQSQQPRPSQAQNSPQIPGSVPQSMQPNQPQTQTRNPPIQPGAAPTSSPGVVNQPSCGVRNNGGVMFQVQGFTENQAQYGEFPWSVALLTLNKGFGADSGATNLFVGGGSLIHPRVVLTGAHKPYDNGPDKTLTVRLGEWNFENQNEPYPHQDIVVKKVIYHPRFNRSQMVYNVALLVLEKPAVLGKTVRTICLPSNPFERFAGSQCILSGWGKDVFGAEGRYQRIMKEVNVNMVEHSQCQAEMRNTHLGTNFNLHQTFVCAGDQGQDACTGDGGSPLVCPQNGRYVQVGVSAWGIGCGKLGRPGVYSAITPAVDWIQDTLKQITTPVLVGDVSDIRRFH